jgi:hypothetical protein
LADVSEALTAVTSMKMEAVSSSEILANFYESASLSIPEDSHLHATFFEVPCRLLGGYQRFG